MPLVACKTLGCPARIDAVIAAGQDGKCSVCASGGSSSAKRKLARKAARRAGKVPARRQHPLGPYVDGAA